jgi:ribose 5-phosphate isomerase B
MKLFIGADHGGFTIKQELITWLTSLGYEMEDCGNTVKDEQDDYPDFAFAVSEKVSSTPDVLGILICRSAGGMVIAANKIKGIRAVAIYDERGAEHARAHNNANIIGLSADWMDIELSKSVLLKFLQTAFSNEERHKRRLAKIAQRET